MPLLDDFKRELEQNGQNYPTFSAAVSQFATMSEAAATAANAPSVGQMSAHDINGILSQIRQMNPSQEYRQAAELLFRTLPEVLQQVLQSRFDSSYPKTKMKRSATAEALNTLDDASDARPQTPTSGGTSTGEYASISSLGVLRDAPASPSTTSGTGEYVSVSNLGVLRDAPASPSTTSGADEYVSIPADQVSPSILGTGVDASGNAVPMGGTTTTTGEPELGSPPPAPPVTDEFQRQTEAVSRRLGQGVGGMTDSLRQQSEVLASLRASVDQGISVPVTSLAQRHGLNVRREENDVPQSTGLDTSGTPQQGSGVDASSTTPQHGGALPQTGLTGGTPQSTGTPNPSGSAAPVLNSGGTPRHSSGSTPQSSPPQPTKNLEDRIDGLSMGTRKLDEGQMDIYRNRYGENLKVSLVQTIAQQKVGKQFWKQTGRAIGEMHEDHAMATDSGMVLLGVSGIVGMVKGAQASAKHKDEVNLSKASQLAEFAYLGAKQTLIELRDKSKEEGSTVSQQELQSAYDDYQTAKNIHEALKVAANHQRVGQQMSQKEYNRLMSKFAHDQELQQAMHHVLGPVLDIGPVAKQQEKEYDQYKADMKAEDKYDNSKQHQQRRFYNQNKFKYDVAPDGSKVTGFIKFDNEALLGINDSQIPGKGPSDKKKQRAYNKLHDRVHKFIDVALSTTDKGTPENPIDLQLEKPPSYETACAAFIAIKQHASENGADYTMRVPKELQGKDPFGNDKTFTIGGGEMTDKEKAFFDHFATKKSYIVKDGKILHSTHNAFQNLYQAQNKKPYWSSKKPSETVAEQFADKMKVVEKAGQTRNEVLTKRTQALDKPEPKKRATSSI